MDRRNTNILIVDDDPFVRSMLYDILISEGFHAETADDGREALERYDSGEGPKPDLIISDMNMEGMNGLELIRRLKDRKSEIPIIILTVNDEISVALSAIRSGASDYLLKDENIHETLLISAERTLEKDRLQRQNRRLLKDLESKNRELEKKNQELLALDQQKNKFLGIAAHDLRGPSGGIRGMIELVLDPELGGDLLSEDQRNFLGMAYDLSGGMLNLIDDLLDVTVIKSGKLDIHLREGDLSGLIRDRILIHKFAAEKKGIRISREIPEEVRLSFDAARISQVFDNLMSNAVKYSPMNSRITVTLRRLPDRVQVSVRDEGPGIPPQDRHLLFGEFQRLSARPTAGEKSTGLGLAIVKKIMDGHRGHVFVEDSPPPGAVFTFEIPRDGDRT